MDAADRKGNRSPCPSARILLQTDLHGVAKVNEMRGDEKNGNGREERKRIQASQVEE
jgi:hypothetical protein